MNLSDKIITADGLHHEVKVCVVEDIQDKLKEFIDWFSSSPEIPIWKVEKKAKEIFGERLT